MTTIFNQHEAADKTPASSEEIQESIKSPQHETNITDGSEFLDDAIRTKDQPLEEVSLNENQQTKSQTKKTKHYEFY